MTDVHVAPSPDHPLPTLVSWPAVFAGAAVAVAFGAMLNLLGVALGAGAFNPFNVVRGGDSGSFTVAAGVWVTVANAIALFLGALIASRAAKHADNHGGMLHGLLVWALAFVVAIVLAGWASAPAASTALAAAQAAANSDPSNALVAPAGALRSDGTYLQADGTVVGADGTVIGKQAAPTAAALAAAPAPAPVAPKAAGTTVTVALWAFLAMLLGAIGAVLGGRYGARRHGWESRLAARETTVAPHQLPL